MATIPRDRFDVKVIKVMVPLSKTDEVGGEEELMVAITNTDKVGTKKKQIAMKKNIGQKLALYPTPATVLLNYARSHHHTLSELFHTIQVLT